MQSKPRPRSSAFAFLLFFASSLAAQAAQDPLAESITGAVDRLAASPNDSTRDLELTVAPPRGNLGGQGFALGAGLGLGSAAALLGGRDVDPRALLIFGGLGGLAGGIGGGLTRPSAGPSELRPGDHIRVVGADSVRGTYLRIDSSGVVIQMPDGAERVVSFDDTRAVQVRRSTRLLAAGGASGAALGAVLGLVYRALCECRGRDGSLMLGLGAVGGAAAGATIGALFTSNDWRDLNINEREERAGSMNPRSRFSVALAPTEGRGIRGQVSLLWR